MNGFWLIAGGFGVLLGLLPGKAAAMFLAFGLAGFVWFASQMGHDLSEGFGWGLLMGIVLLLPLLLGWFLGLALKFTMRKIR